MIRRLLLSLGCGLFLATGCRSVPVPYAEEEAARRVLDTRTLWRSCRGTPAEFAANWLWQYRTEAAVVRDGMPGDYAAAVRLLAEYDAKIRRGLEWGEPRREVVIPYLSVAPTLDGRISEEEAAQCLRFDGEYPIDSALKTVGMPSLWLAGWHGDRLYLAARFPDDEVISADGKAETPDRKMHEADSLEFFIRPDRKRPHYFEFIANPEGRLWSLEHWCSERGGFFILDIDRKTETRVAAARIPGGYSLELSVPLREFHGGWCRRPPRPGDVFDFMPVRTNRDGETCKKSTPVPFLYDGHNIFGYIRAVLGKQERAQ